MSHHPYLRAYMAGITVPTMFLLVFLTVFCILRFVHQVPVPIERVIVFPMAIIPNLFGVWNMLYVRLGPGRRFPVGIHGALLPFILAPVGLSMAAGLGFVALTADAVVWFDTFLVPYARLAIIFPGAVGVYYLVWKHLVGFFNEVLGIA